MISLSWKSNFEPNSFDMDRHISSLVQAFRGLPRHIAKKHMKAAMRRLVKPGVPMLRALTPPLGTRRGRRAKGQKPRSTGDLRRSVAAKAGWTGRNTDLNHFVWGVLGYRHKGQDRKAIWLNYGTRGGVRPFQMIEQAMAQFGPITAKRMAEEMQQSLEKATREIASGKNPGR